MIANTNIKHAMADQLLNESIFKQIVETNWVAITYADLNGIVSYANKAAYQLYEYEEGELIGENVDIFNGDDNENTNEIVEKIKTTGIWKGILNQRRKDGTTFTAQLYVWLIKDKNGSPLGLASNSKDITLEIANQEKIKNSEKDLRLILNSLPIGVYILDREGKPFYTNNFTRTFAKKDIDTDVNNLDTSEKWKVYKRHSDEEYPLEELPIMRALKGENSSINDLDIDIEGNRYHVTSTGVALKDGNGIKYAISAFSDISDIVKKEAEITVLMNSQEFYFLSVNKNLEIIRYNKTFEQAINHNYPDQLKPGALISDFIPDIEKKSTLNLYKKAFTGEVVIDERTYTTKGGDKVTFESRYAPIITKGKVFAISVTSLNITERKRKEDQLQKTLKEKKLLLNEIHHRVKNNLAIVSSLLQLEELKTDNNEIKDILISSQNRIKSTALVHQFLYQNDSIANIQFKEYVTEFISQIERSLLIDLDIKTTVNGNHFNLDIEQAIPCGLILNELFTNSIKHAFKGVKNPEINITLKKAINTVSITFEDNGTGIPKDLNHSNSLGMTVVKTLVKQLKETLDVNSKNGAIFRITFEIN